MEGKSNRIWNASLSLAIKYIQLRGRILVDCLPARPHARFKIVSMGMIQYAPAVYLGQPKEEGRQGDILA
jgi:hypothetical protein